MIDCLIFSKDRAMQLELLLRSINFNFPELKNISVLYKVTTDNFRKGYEILQEQYKINWIEEKDFVSDIKKYYSQVKDPFCLTFCDDEVIVNSFPVFPQLDYFKSRNIHCISIRLHPEVTYCYTANLPNNPPQFVHIKENCYIWDWRSGDPRVDWYYPSCINSHIYRSGMLNYFIQRIPYTSVHNLEGLLNHQRELFAPLMICYKEPKSITIANNKTQTGTNRYGLNPEYTTNSLNDKFLDGCRIDLTPLISLKNQSPTFEHGYTFVTKN